MKLFIKNVLVEIDIALNLILKTRFKFSFLISLFLLIQSPSNKLQNETNPTSVALFVWKWQPDEEEGVLENIAKFSKFGILPVFKMNKQEIG